MKKLLLTALGCLFLLSSLASANEWGLSGGAYDIIAEDKRYEGYTAAADNGNESLKGYGHVNQVIMKNRYDVFLMSVSRRDKVWQLDTENHAAVYQPGDERGEFPYTPGLMRAGDDLILTYGDRERYRFSWNGEEYILCDVRYKQDEKYTDCFIRMEYGLEFWQSNPAEAFLPIGDGMWPTVITLDEFNITQMPRSLSEVRRATMVSDALAEVPRLEASGSWQGVKDAGMLAVYAAPDAASYRSASGKASVSLGGDMTIYGTMDGWTLVGYEVSTRTSRIGYVNKALGDEPLAFTAVALRAAEDTFLTDDPFVSQYAQVQIPRDALLTGLAQCGEYYAYVEYRADKIYRGFVPMKDLITVYDRALSTGTEHPTADVRWDVMDALCGKWYAADGSFRDDVVLFSNGGFHQREGHQIRDIGNYRVYDGAEGAYSIYFVTEANQENTCTLALNKDGTITLDGQIYRREEYSTYGNG